jgi:hypothetical protein
MSGGVNPWIWTGWTFGPVAASREGRAELVLAPLARAVFIGGMRDRIGECVAGNLVEA